MLWNTELSKVLHIQTATPMKPLLPDPLASLDQDSDRDYAYGAPPVKKPQYPTKTTDKRGRCLSRSNLCEFTSCSSQ